MSPLLFALSACALLAHTANAAAFLTARGDLFAEIEGALGAEKTSGRIAAMEDALRPMYAAVPKNRQGRLDHSAVRYVLHRFFNQLHGWHVTGLEPGNGTVDTAPRGVDALDGQVTPHAEQMFKELLGGSGLALRELAEVAVAVERLIHNEASARLMTAYERLSLSTESTLESRSSEHVLDAYMALYLIGSSLSEKKHPMMRLIAVMPKIYPGWHDTRAYVRDTMYNIEFLGRHRLNPFVPQAQNFDSTLRVVERVGEQFGKYQDVECQELKDALVAQEIRGSGRVRLQDFYRLGLEGKFLLRESMDYLRSLGALDESNAREPRVIVPNFVLSKSNCLASTNLYTVCCINECERLMGNIEMEIAAPVATPSRIVELVAKMPSPTVEAPRNLSDSMIGRLNEIANGKQGVVLLHGRLFAQWLHHAYPRECPYPHMMGTTSSLEPTDWESVSGSSVTMSIELLEKYLEVAGTKWIEEVSEDDLLPWHPEEELVMHPTASLPSILARQVKSLGRSLMLASVVLSMGVGLIRTFKDSFLGGQAKLVESHFV